MSTTGSSLQSRAATWLALVPASWVMERRMRLGLRERAEGCVAGSAGEAPQVAPEVTPSAPATPAVDGALHRRARPRPGEDAGRSARVPADPAGLPGVASAAEGPIRTAAFVARLAVSPDPVLAWLAFAGGSAETSDAAEVARLRRTIPGSPRAQALLAHREADGTIRLHPYAKWQGPHWTLYSLAVLGYPPGDPDLLPLRDQVYAWLLEPRFLRRPFTVAYPDQPGRVRRCASQEGNAVWYSLELGVEDEHTEVLVDRLVALQWPDGGWNCDKRPEARVSSIQETLIPLRGLWAFWTRHGHAMALAASDRAAEMLLARRLLWRRRDGTLIQPDWGGAVDRIHFPIRFYDVLFALEVLAETGHGDDPRLADARALLDAKRLPDGGFPREVRTATTTDRIRSDGTFAEWGRGGTRRGNPFVSTLARRVLLSIAARPAVRDPGEPADTGANARR